MKTKLLNVAAFAVLVILLTACLDEDSKQKPTSNPQAPPAPPKPAVMSARNLSQAISIAKPEMSDTEDTVSAGAVTLAIWASANMKWSELRALPATEHALVMKDPDQERGKKMCISGHIIEIAAEKTDWGKFFEGGIWGDDDNLYRFTAVGSTGALVAKSRAGFCGVVIGRQDYQNSAGGTAHAVYLVGMFNIPETANR